MENLSEECHFWGLCPEALSAGLIFVDHFLARLPSKKMGNLSRQKMLLSCLYLVINIYSGESWDDKNRIIEESQSSHVQSDNFKLKVNIGPEPYKVGLEPEKNAFVIKRIIAETWGSEEEILVKCRQKTTDMFDQFPKSIYSKWRDQQCQGILIESCTSGKPKFDPHCEFPEPQNDLLSESNSKAHFTSLKNPLPNWNLRQQLFNSDFDALGSPARSFAKFPQTTKKRLPSTEQLFQERLDRMTLDNGQMNRDTFVKNYIEGLFQNFEKKPDSKRRLTTEQVLDFAKRKLGGHEVERFLLELVESLNFKGKSANKSCPRQFSELLRLVFGVFPHRPPVPSTQLVSAGSVSSGAEPVPRTAVHCGLAGVSTTTLCSEQATLFQTNLPSLRSGRKQTLAQLRDSAAHSGSLI